MKKVIEQILRKVLGEVLGAESLAKALMRVAEKVLAEHPEWVKAIAAKAKEIAEEGKGSAETAGTAGTEGTAEAAGESPAPPAGEPALSWCYGGFDGSRAEVSADAVLKGATLKGDTLSLEWAKGGCEQLGAADSGDTDHTVACLFLEDGAGGKFEWISTSRKTRSVKNVKEGYNGWPSTALDGGGKLWFCIAGVRDDQATSNGKRTNLVEVKRA